MEPRNIHESPLNGLPIALFSAISDPIVVFDECCEKRLWNNQSWDELQLWLDRDGKNGGKLETQLREHLASGFSAFGQKEHWENKIEVSISESRLLPINLFVQKLDSVLLIVVKKINASGTVATNDCDPLTLLPGRTTLLSALEEALSNRDESTDFALLFIDLDGFKSVNDQYGHLIGDAVLKRVATRLANSVRTQDLMTRFGGDEFIALIRNIQESQDVKNLSNRIHESLESPVRCEKHEIAITASIGTALASEDWDTAEEMIAAADRRMYETKRGSR